MSPREHADALETLQWWREDAARRWAKAQPQPMGESWKPVMTPEEKAAHDAYVEANSLPF